MDVVELVNKYGFPIVMAVGMGFIIKYVWEWATKDLGVRYTSTRQATTTTNLQAPTRTTTTMMMINRATTTLAQTLRTVRCQRTG